MVKKINMRLEDQMNAPFPDQVALRGHFYVLLIRIIWDCRMEKIFTYLREYTDCASKLRIVRGDTSWLGRCCPKMQLCAFSKLVMNTHCGRKGVLG